MKTTTALISGLLFACGTSTATLEGILEGIESGGLGLQPGIIRFADEPILITVPPEAAVGTPIVIHLTTYGGGCMWKGPTETTVTELTVIVAPFDDVRIPDSGTICPAHIATFKHSAEVTFERAGEASVAVRGREWPGNESFERLFRVIVQ